MMALRSLLNRFLSKLSFADGSYIVPFDRDYYRYVERDGHAMGVEAYLTSSGHAVDRVVVASSIKQWANPHKNEDISETKHSEILQKFVEYFESKRITFRIDL